MKHTTPTPKAVGRSFALTALSILFVLLGFGLLPFQLSAENPADCTNRYDLAVFCPTVQF